MFSLTTRTRNCEGFSRRSFLRVGSLSLFGLTLPRLLEAAANAAPGSRKDVNCILLWTDGGMSNIDTLDMKPDAPAEFRGEFSPIASNVPGVHVCEHLPMMSERMDKVCQVRSIVHSGSQHAEACHFMLTGYPQIPDVSAQPVGVLVYPCLGSVVNKEKGWRDGMPPFVQLSSGGIKYHHAGYLGGAYNPLHVSADPSRSDFSVQDVSIPDQVGAERTMRRRRMLDELDAWQQAAETSDVLSVVAERQAFYAQAYDLITSPAAKRAFRIDEEPAAVRERYGMNRVGQSTLLARRLIEAGVRFVTVESNGWDTHDKNFVELKNDLLPPLDRAWSALLDDLEQRGLLDNTLVICAGEFGRTPKVNGAAGRDHYPKCNAIGLSGAGVAMVHVVGKTDARCENVVSKQHSTLDYAATIYKLLGVDYHQEYITEDGRPVSIAGGGEPIAEVFA